MIGSELIEALNGIESTIRMLCYTIVFCMLVFILFKGD